jgi:hypothetical protein
LFAHCYLLPAVLGWNLLVALLAAIYSISYFFTKLSSLKISSKDFNFSFFWVNICGNFCKKFCWKPDAKNLNILATTVMQKRTKKMVGRLMVDAGMLQWLVVHRVTRWITQKGAQPILIPRSLLCTVKKCSQKIWATSIIFRITAKSKQSPNRQKFAQSGHPGCSQIKHLHRRNVSSLWLMLWALFFQHENCVYSNTFDMNRLLHKFAPFWVKNYIFCQNFWQQYFSNHNICPRVEGTFEPWCKTKFTKYKRSSLNT